MKLLLFVCVCALASADQQEAAPTAGQLAVGLTHLYRRFLHVTAPKQLRLIDALEMKYSNGMMAAPPFTSAVKGTFDGHDHFTFAILTSLVNPGQKGYSEEGPWIKQDLSDLVVTYQYGGAVKIHMITIGGRYSEVIVGNPLRQKKAKFVAVVPKDTYLFVETLSSSIFFHSSVAVPAWNPAAAEHFTNQDMEVKFPEHAEIFRYLDKPMVAQEHDHHDDRHGDRSHRD